MKIYYIEWDDEPGHGVPQLYLSRADAEAEAARLQREWVPPEAEPDWMPTWSVFEADVIEPNGTHYGTGCGS